MENEYVIGADLYDHVEAYRTRTDVGFFVDLAKETGGPVLELGCGTGRNRQVIPSSARSLPRRGDAATQSLSFPSTKCL